MKNYCFLIESEEKMLEFGRRLASMLQAGDVLYLQGDLGAGKTTLSRGILLGLGYKDFVKSPSYTWVELYEFDNTRVVHVDLYRATDPTAIRDLGLSDYLTEEAILLVEWPEKWAAHLPVPSLSCFIEAVGNCRILKLENTLPRFEKFLSYLILN